MKWEHDDLLDEWDLRVDTLPVQIEGFEFGSGVNVSRDNVSAESWRVTTLGTLLLGRWHDVEAAKAAAVVTLEQWLNDALAEVKKGVGA